MRDRVAERHPDLRVEIEIINTKGDKILDAPLAKIGDKGLFTKELETALLDGRIDVAVHSAKDMPTAVPEGLEIIAFTEREDVRDVFVPNPALTEHRAPGAGPLTLDDVPQGARVGTLEPAPPLAAPGAAARPRRGRHPRQRRDPPAQARRGGDGGDDPGGGGALAPRPLRGHRASPSPSTRCSRPSARARSPSRRGRTTRACKELQAALDHRPTALAVSAERALLGTLEGGCQVPIAAHAHWKADGERGAGTLVLGAYVGSLDGARCVRGERARLADDPEGLGIFLAAELLERGAGDILDEIRTP